MALLATELRVPLYAAWIIKPNRRAKTQRITLKRVVLKKSRMAFPPTDGLWKTV